MLTWVIYDIAGDKTRNKVARRCLDFGLYRIMHAKSAEVTKFLDKELLPQVKQAFALYKTADKAELERELANAISQAQALGADRNSIERIAHHRKIIAARIGDRQALALANEQLDAERRLQRLDLMAHRSLGHGKLLSRAREALAARRSLEGLERVQGRQAAKHLFDLHEKN